jgi:glycerol dehydrogenase
MQAHALVLTPMAQRTKSLAAPRRYVQGPGVLKEIGAHIASFGGKKALLTGGKSALASVRDIITKSCQDAGISTVVELFGNPAKVKYGPECCEEEINRLADLAKANNCDTIIAAGGGKAIDTGKNSAANIGALKIVVPTIAATDAPTSALSVLYDPKTHAFKSVSYYPTNPDLVIVDTEIVAKAPARMQCSGIGDGFSKKYEGEANVRSGGKNCLVKNLKQEGTTLTALTLCRLGNEIYREYGVAAMLSNLKGVPSPAFEWLIEANVLLSGLGFESCGLAAAHAVNDGLTVLEPKMDPFPQYHGELVHFGTLTQMVLEDRPVKEILDVMEWSHAVGLPVCFEDIGLREPTDEDLLKAGQAATAPPPPYYMHDMYFTVTPKMIVEALKTVDALGRTVKTPRLKLPAPAPYPWAEEFKRMGH